MIVVFVSNYFNHHQKPFCDAMCAITQGKFVFIETSVMREERKKLGYGQDTKPVYVKSMLSDETEAQECQALVDGAEAVIFGGAPYDMIVSRLKTGKLTFKYSERIYKKTDCPWWKFPLRAVQFYRMYGRFKQLYLLSASAYAAGDYAKTGTFVGKAYQWGYFPEQKIYDIDALWTSKKIADVPQLLWVGRMIDWKHPDDAVAVAERLVKDGYRFELHMIGTGVMENGLAATIKEKGLEACVCLQGSMRPEQVREYMEKAQIYLFTSDRQEGWGAVLNEAMNSGCAVVADRAIGSVPYLMVHGENGQVYNGMDELYHHVKNLLDDPARCEAMGRSAYRTIAETWNAEQAAERFLTLVKDIQNNGCSRTYTFGPGTAEVAKHE